MRRFRNRRVFIRLVKLPSTKKISKLFVKISLFLAAVFIACSPGTVNALQSLTKWTGSSSGLMRAVYMLEFGKKPDSKSELYTQILSVSFPKYSSETPATNNSPPPVETKAPPSPSLTPSSAPTATPTPTPKPSPSTTPVLRYEDIEIKGETDGINVAALLNEPLKLKFDGAPQILIIHTHGTESYVCDGSYAETSEAHTLDMNYSVIRVGQELTKELERKGFTVIHDRGKYDYPSYSGSYSRSLASTEEYLKKYPSIKVVIDLHRDAFMDVNGNTYKTSFNINGEESAQVMLVVGIGSAGLENPNWEENLKLAFRLQAAMNLNSKGLARPINISSDRYNQHVALGALLVEVGSSGNTLQESLTAVRLFAEAASQILS